ncbi:MAG: cyclopropane-fatty-acyl-phospholipid synthase, partial [Propionibacterium sp.]|nr:cyclopropane-fatty-acyl-phospholipid synthase [Propionibacterium sp.]
ILAARRGAEVTSITISPSQAALARERIAAAGLSERVSVELRDYREQQGRFDAVVSIEMIEAVGEEFWPGYFQAIDRALVPGGRGVIQAILMTEERFEATRNSYGWIQKHIFPGGIIPSVGALQRAADPSGLRITPVDMFGHDYAETLRRWRSRFLENWPMVRDMGFDDVFQRRWEFYLAYCEAGFDAAAIDVGQLVLERVGSLRADAARAEALAG